MLVLPFSSGTLRLDIDEDGICVVQLVSDRALMLGSELLSKVRHRFIRILASKAEVDIAGKIDGVPAAWLIGFSDTNISVYATKQAEGLVLHFQDENCQYLARAQLSACDCSRWLSMLSEPGDPLVGVHL